MPRLNIINFKAHYLLFLSLIWFGLPIASLNAQETSESDSVEEAIDSSNETEQSPVSIFSIEGGDRLMMEADEAVNKQEYDLAAKKLQSARQVYNQLSNFYLQLFNSLTGLDNAAAESNRKKALDTGVKRDEATYQLALVHRAQNKPELSIPLFVQIITSQSPGAGLGKKAYEQLLEIGFVDVPFTPPGQGNNPPVNVPPASDPAPNNSETEPIQPEPPASADPTTIPQP